MARMYQATVTIDGVVVKQTTPCSDSDLAMRRGYGSLILVKNNSPLGAEDTLAAFKHFQFGTKTTPLFHPDSFLYNDGLPGESESCNGRQ